MLQTPEAPMRKGFSAQTHARLFFELRTTHLLDARLARGVTKIARKAQGALALAEKGLASALP